MNIDIVSVAAITVICLLIGKAVKASPVKNELIPVIVGAFGGLLGVAGMYIIPDFPATDIINAIAVGIMSGLGSTGVHQLYKQIATFIGGTKDADNGNSI